MQFPRNYYPNPKWKKKINSLHFLLLCQIPPLQFIKQLGERKETPTSFPSSTASWRIILKPICLKTKASIVSVAWRIHS